MSHPRILLVDDDNSIRKMYADALVSAGFDVVETGSAVDALELLLQGEKFDLVITDIMMARMDGWELLETIRKAMGFTETALPVIVISAFNSAELETKAFSRGANGFLIKPIVPLSKLVNLAKIHTGRVRSKYHVD